MRLSMTISQQHSAQWPLAAIDPSSFGGLVWLRRRK
jgi:hypothetical protein